MTRCSIIFDERKMFDFQIQQPCNVCVLNHDHDEAIADGKQKLECPISYDCYVKGTLR